MSSPKHLTTLAALAAILALAPVSVLEADPAVSPFTGTYLWGAAGNPVTISEDGRITSSTLDVSGRVRADGTYSFTVTQIIYVEDETPPYSHKPRFITIRTKFTGTMAFDLSGNIVGTPDNVGSQGFTWLRP